MNKTIINALKEQVLFDLGGNDELSDVINEAVIRAFEQNGIDTSTDKGFDALSEVASSFYLDHQ